MLSKKLRFGIMGCGFWADYQIAGWMEVEGVELVALYNRTRDKADALALKYQVPAVYDSAEEMLRAENLDFVDIITDVNTHSYFTLLAAAYGIPVICQKPMAPNFREAAEMVATCKREGVPLFIHENFRWQAPIRKVKDLLDRQVIGQIFKARVTYCSAFPVIANQPFLAELEEFILTDIGSHILDVCRFLFGEAQSIYCVTHRVNPLIKGEDVANIAMKMASGLFCFAEMSYASILEHEVFPETLLLIEGDTGSIQLQQDYVIKVTTPEGTRVVKAPPHPYSWTDPLYEVVHSSIVDCNRNILDGLQEKQAAETTGADNFETVRLVWAAYASAKENRVVDLREFNIPAKARNT